MRLRGIEFGPVWGASGVRGFFDEGYWFHPYLKPFGLNFRGSTFVAKTMTLEPRVGNMPLKPDYTPVERFPKCIVVDHRKAIGLNSVGLSNPGANTLFDTGNWQRLREPFFLSFMSVAQNPQVRVHELMGFIRIARSYKPTIRVPFGLQINFSCPNVGLHMEELVREVEHALEVAALLEVPLVPKFNLLLPPDAIAEIAKHPRCDAICLTNTVPWGSLPDKIDWKGLFGSENSPLADLGGGGLSGRPLLPLLCDWLDEARKSRISKPLNVGGGILGTRDALRAWHHAKETLVGGDVSISLGSIAFLRPLRVRGIIRSFNRHRLN